MVGALALESVVANGQVLQMEELTKTIASYFETDKVELIKEDGGRVTLIPIDKARQQAACDLVCGMWKGSGMSSEEFIRNKRFEKELEG